MQTQVGIVGAGPAGLMLSHLLHLNGIDSVVIDTRTREDIEGTIRAGVLEQSTVDLMTETGVGERVKRIGQVHEGIEIRYNGRGHRIDFTELTGRAVTLYPQHEVLKDLIARRVEDGGDLRFGVTDVRVEGLTTDKPVISFSHEGRTETLECAFVAGCDGSRSTTRTLIPAGEVRQDLFRQYPFAWFGILVEAPPSSDELIYANHENGFALISTRTPTVQRLYLQVDPDDEVDDWPDDRIWEELHTRVSGEDVTIEEGRIFSKSVLPFRSYVCEPMQHGRLFLAGDAAHTVPPTGAKGMNLAIADVYVLAKAFARCFERGDTQLLDSYTDTALRRVWRAQHFSWWMTSMLHRMPESSGFDRKRQLAELDVITSSAAGRRLLAENYVGLPLEL
ncbi:4-hydroxybenzoate 3-monooxygenase [Saccharopolyspora rectivirgula]|jgi:p-hydroxybenzoate 3-monooxygenase|uniref:4-hydroxybenzoate 3-monooxygenase n=1 Tax=Saccharopolyspora rectivirgula TaxID=28042 RepID=A0A073B3G0_9PSEU|nr:4-hydroxybenzoate 3-monooxygenase [Saccharopolyspora rectivirgula]KEI45802.1 4-hydroxybenzoate 3-monooxygenase [Saccharopolyspora rectivirgula]